VDDTIITKDKDFYVVLNAACFDKDMKHIQTHLKSVPIKNASVTHSLLALQGPLAVTVLQKLVSSNLSEMDFMTSAEMSVASIPCRVTRCGYTGEDGFEVSVPHDKAVALAKKFLSFEEVKNAGLAVRDSLRLEGGLCLYGNDIDDHTTPVEANLVWTIAKRKKEGGGFLGDQAVLSQLKNKPKRLRIGFQLNKGIARAHDEIHKDGKKIGEVTSGGWSWCVEKGIGMGYLDTSSSDEGVNIDVVMKRGKKYEGNIIKLPVPPVRNRYYRIKKAK